MTLQLVWCNHPISCSPQPSFPRLHSQGLHLAGQAALSAKGGETEALKRVKHYLWDTDRIADYFNTRNGMLGPDYSTKLAAWLAHGCVSPRYVHHEIQKYQDQRTSNKSTYWVCWPVRCDDCVV